MKIRDVMTRNVEMVSPDQTAREAAAFMARAEAGSIPVCENDRLVGMITDRDIAIRGVAEGKGADCSVRELMSEGIICASEDDEVEAVAKRMADEQIRRLPVLDANKRIVGIVSLGDLARETDGRTAETALEGVAQPGGAHQQ